MKPSLLKNIMLIIAVAALDQASKYWLMFSIGMIDGRTYELTSFFNLVMVWNQGVSFGLFATGSDSSRWFLIAVAAVIIAALSSWMHRSDDSFIRTALSLVMGGAIGNVVDRLTFGAVADFFDFHINNHHWPAFNVADMAICLGVALLVYDSIIRSRNQDVK